MKAEHKFRVWNNKQKTYNDHEDLVIDLQGRLLDRDRCVMSQKENIIEFCTEKIAVNTFDMLLPEETYIYDGDVIRHHTNFNVEIHGKYVDYCVKKVNGVWIASYWESEKGPIFAIHGTATELFKLGDPDVSKNALFSEDDMYKKMNVEIVGTIHNK